MSFWDFLDVAIHADCFGPVGHCAQGGQPWWVRWWWDAEPYVALTMIFSGLAALVVLAIWTVRAALIGNSKLTRNA